MTGRVRVLLASVSRSTRPAPDIVEAVLDATAAEGAEAGGVEHSVLEASATSLSNASMTGT